MARPRRKKSAKKAAKPAGKAKRATGLLTSLAQYVKKKASGLVKRRKAKRAKRAPKGKAKASAPT